MAGIIQIYNSIPRLKRVVTNKIISPVSGANPADAGPVKLPNTRGNLIIVGTSGDNSFSWTLEVNGGHGRFPTDFTQNFFFQIGSNVNCTVITLQTNKLEITTPAGDSGGRKYILQFKPLQSVPPTVQQITGNIIGNNTLTINVTYCLIVNT